MTDDHSSEEQIARWREEFEELADVEGFITKRDLEVYLQRNNKNPTDTDLDTLIESIQSADTEADGKIGLEEFIKIQQEASKMTFYCSDIQVELEKALKAFDDNDDGTISRDELKKILEDYNDEILEDVIRHAEVSEGGRLSIKELASYLTKKFG